MVSSGGAGPRSGYLTQRCPTVNDRQDAKGPGRHVPAAC